MTPDGQVYQPKCSNSRIDSFAGLHCTYNRGLFPKGDLLSV